MNIGSTPTHTFIAPNSVDLTTASKIQIVYTQRGKEIVKKNRTDATISGQNISVTLTQAETFAFDKNGTIKIQVRIKLNSGAVMASDIITTTPQECLDSNIM